MVDLVTGSLRECVCPLPARGMLEKGWGKRACALGREGGEAPAGVPHIACG